MARTQEVFPIPVAGGRSDRPGRAGGAGSGPATGTVVVVMSTPTRPAGPAAYQHGAGARTAAGGSGPTGGGRRESRWASPRWWVALEFLGVIGFQLFHQLEHTLEVVEKRLDHPGVRPLLGGVDFEWAHFFGNTLLLACSVALVVGSGRAGRARWRATSRVAWAVLLGGVWVQGTHVIEHVVRVVQYVTGSTVPAGLATRWVDPVWFHFGINLVFLAGLLVGFLGLGLHRDLLGRRPADPVSAG